MQACKRLLGPNCELSDQDLEEIRDKLYGLAQVVVTWFEKTKTADAASPGMGRLR